MILIKKYFFIIFVAYLAIFLSSNLFAQENLLIGKDTILVENLDEVIVTATRTIRQLSSLPLPAQIVSKEDILSAGSVRLDDILNEQTGLITVSDFGGGEGIQLQGMDAQYILILVDGVPLVGRSAGTLDLQRISVGNIKQIEIVKGASSSLYGSEALGGVINIVSETPEIGFTGDVNYKLGTFNSHDLSTSLNYKKRRMGMSAFINRNSSDGYDLTEKDDVNTVDAFRNYTLSSKLSYAFKNETDLLISGKFYTQKKDVVSSSVLMGESEINEWNTHAKLSHRYGEKWSSYFEFYTTQYKSKELIDNADGAGFNDRYYDQLLIRPEIRASYNPNKRTAFIGGVGFNHETLKRTDFSQKPVFNSPYIYLQYDVNPSDRLNVILGSRFDGHNVYEAQFSPKVALRYELSHQLAMKGSVGYGFKAPDFRQLYFDFSNASVGYAVLGYDVVPSKVAQWQAEEHIASLKIPLSKFEDGLRPESSISYNSGIDYRPNSRLMVGLNLFRNNIKDLIDYRILLETKNGAIIYSYLNVSEVITEGFELNTTWRPINRLRVSAGYQFLLAKDKDAESAFDRGEVFARKKPTSPSFQLKKADYYGLYNRSRHMANLKLFYVIPQWHLDVNFRTTYRSKYAESDSNESSGYLDRYDTFIKGYAIFNFAMNKTFFKKYDLGFGVDNIFDYKDPQNIKNVPGKLFYGKLNIQF